MRATVYLDACPFCHCTPFLFMHSYPNGEYDWLLAGNPECPVCNNIGSIEDEDVDAFIEAWNNCGVAKEGAE